MSASSRALVLDDHVRSAILVVGVPDRGHLERAELERAGHVVICCEANVARDATRLFRFDAILILAGVPPCEREGVIAELRGHLLPCQWLQCIEVSAKGTWYRVSNLSAN
jgi:hypothetical protein